MIVDIAQKNVILEILFVVYAEVPRMLPKRAPRASVLHRQSAVRYAFSEAACSMYFDKDRCFTWGS